MTVVIIVVKMAVGMVRIIKDPTVRTVNSLKGPKIDFRLGQHLKAGKCGYARSSEGAFQAGSSS